MHIILLIAIGLLVGYGFTRVMPLGRDAIAAIVIAGLGAALGGLLVRLLVAFAGFFAGIAGAVAGALVLLAIWRYVTAR